MAHPQIKARKSMSDPKTLSVLPDNLKKPKRNPLLFPAVLSIIENLKFPMAKKVLHLHLKKSTPIAQFVAKNLTKLKESLPKSLGGTKVVSDVVSAKRVSSKILELMLYVTYIHTMISLVFLHFSAWTLT